MLYQNNILSILSKFFLDSEPETVNITGDFLNICEKNKVLFLVNKALGESLISNDMFQIKKKDAEAICDKNLKNLREVIHIFNQNNIDYIYIKGMALSNIIYQDIYVRGFGDIDLIIPEEKINEAFSLLNSIKYKSILGVDNLILNNGRKYCEIDKPIYKDGFSGHEVIEMVKKDDSIYTVIELKRHLSQIIRKNYIHYYFENIEVLKLHNLNVRTLNENFSFINLMINTYINDTDLYSGTANLRDYCDLAYFIKYKKINYKVIKNIMERLSIIYIYNYIFTNLKNLEFISDKKYYYYEEVKDIQNITEYIFENRKDSWCRKIKLLKKSYSSNTFSTNIKGVLMTADNKKIIYKTEDSNLFIHIPKNIDGDIIISFFENNIENEELYIDRVIVNDKVYSERNKVSYSIIDKSEDIILKISSNDIDIYKISTYIKKNGILQYEFSNNWRYNEQDSCIKSKLKG